MVESRSVCSVLLCCVPGRVAARANSGKQRHGRRLSFKHSGTVVCVNLRKCMCGSTADGSGYGGGSCDGGFATVNVSANS